MRAVMVIRHVTRPEAIELNKIVERELRAHSMTPVGVDYQGDAEIMLALGGDGTLLSAAEIARERNIPLIGINLGHMGFLTEVESDHVQAVVEHLATGDYTIDNRMTLDVQARMPDGSVRYDWALNECALVNNDVQHPARLGVGVDERGLSTYGADGFIIATPTGSTAYAFSAGGPIVWPDVEAVVAAPLAAHGLFTRPIVISPNSTLQVTILRAGANGLAMTCDGIRTVRVQPGTTITATRGARPVKLVRISSTPFIERLVHKFDLPVKGWKAMNYD